MDGVVNSKRGDLSEFIDAHDSKPSALHSDVVTRLRKSKRFRDPRSGVPVRKCERTVGPLCWLFCRQCGKGL